MTYVLFIIGFVFLIKGADFLVVGASSFAKKFNISDLIIGLTVIAFGTSMPEFFVNIMSSIKGTSEIAIGNILGSNIFNILIVLGISAIITPLVLTTKTSQREVPINLLAVLIMAFLTNEALLFAHSKVSHLSRIDGFMMLIFFIIAFSYFFKSAHSEKEKHIHEVVKSHALFKDFLLIAFGLAGLIIGAEWIVNGAIDIAKRIGLSQLFISSTIIAGGTSLPELAASVMAVKKKKTSMAVGNVIGSNIFNIFFILGASAVIRPLPFVLKVDIDIVALFIASSFLFLTLITSHRKCLLEKWQGVVCVLLYVGYIVFLLMRG